MNYLAWYLPTAFGVVAVMMWVLGRREKVSRTAQESELREQQISSVLQQGRIECMVSDSRADPLANPLRAFPGYRQAAVELVKQGPDGQFVSIPGSHAEPRMPDGVLLRIDSLNLTFDANDISEVRYGPVSTGTQTAEEVRNMVGYGVGMGVVTAVATAVGVGNMHGAGAAILAAVIAGLVGCSVFGAAGYLVGRMRSSIASRGTQALTEFELWNAGKTLFRFRVFNYLSEHTVATFTGAGLVCQSNES